MAAAEPEPKPAAQAQRERDAARRKLAFDALVKNATAKSSQLERRLLTSFAFGTANLMLAEILAGKVEPKDAKQAAEIAKIALDIGRTEMGEGSVLPENLEPYERRAKIAEAKAMLAEIRERGNALAAEDPSLVGKPNPAAPPALAVVGDEWDFDDPE